jgi:hypothetical protein
MSMLRTDEVPSGMTALASSPGVSSGMPAATAASRTFSGPISRVRSTNAVLMDSSVAWTRSTDEP